MAYIEKTFYDSTFKGVTIPESEFERLADIASDIVYEVCNVKPKESDLMNDDFMKAVCYQVEFLYEQGGVDAIVGFSESELTSGRESLGDYSVTAENSSRQSIAACGGIPVSGMTIMKLRKLGLMSRWALAEYYGQG